MIPQQARLVRRGLLWLLVVSVLSIAIAYRHGRGGREPLNRITIGSSDGRAAGTRLGDVVIRKLVDGKELFAVRAATSEAEGEDTVRLSEVEATVPRSGGAAERPVTITARKCLYDSRRQRINFQGDVRASTGGLLLAADSFFYDVEARTGRTDDRVEFRRGDLRAEGTGANWDGIAETLDIRSTVVVERDALGDRPALSVRAADGLFERQTLIATVAGGVRAALGGETLECQTLRAYLTEDLSRIQRLVALDDVVLTSDPAGTATTLGGAGLRSIRSRRLEVSLDETGAPKFVRAVNKAQVVLEPPGRRQRTLLSGGVIDLILAGGRLAALRADANVRMQVEPTGGPAGPVRTVTCGNLYAEADSSGNMETFRFGGGVEFAEGARKARSSEAVWQQREDRLALSGGSTLVDADRGSELRASSIDLTTGTADVRATGQVRHVVTRRGAADGAGFARGATTEVTAQEMRYDASGRTAHYRGGAVLSSGRDILCGDEVTVEEPASGHRRLTATGAASSRLSPRPNPRAKREASPVESRSERLVYEEASRTVDYEGDVQLTQGDLTTKSPRATVTLSADGAQIERLVAGEPVEVIQGARKATGRQATYLDAQQTLVLEGDLARVEDATRRFAGRTVTVYVADDRVVVQGGEEDRTESVFTRDGPISGARKPKEPRH